MRGAFVLAFLLGALLAACGGGGSPLPMAVATPASAAQTSPKKATGSATFAIFIPTASAMKKARPNYVSPNTAYAGITATEVSGVPVPSPTPLVVDLTPGSTSCSTSSTGTTCAVTATYLVGVDAWTIALYGSGGVTSTPLSISSVSQTVVAGQNTVNLTMNPVVASLAFSPTSSSCRSNDATCVQSAALEALDATNAVIVGPGNYVNASRTPVTINVASAPSGVSLETSSGSAAATSATGPAQLNLAQVAYNGSGSTGTLTISASDTNGDAASYALNLTTPTPSPAPTSTPSTSGLPPFGMFNSCEIDEGASSCESQEASMYSAGITYEVNYLSMVAHLTGTNSLDALLTANDTSGTGGGVRVKTYISLKNIMADTNFSTGTNLIQFTYGSAACGANTSCMASDCGVSTDKALLACVDAMAKTHPSFAGYYLADEPGSPNGPSSGLPPAGNFGMVNQVAAYLQSIDPTASILVLNTGGGNATLAKTAPSFSCDGQAPCASPTAPATPFPWITDSYTPNTGFDFFPLAGPSGSQATAEATAPPGTTTAGQYIAQTDATWGFLYTIFQDNYPSETASFVGQAFSWYQEGGSGCSTYAACVYPTQTQQQLQRDHALYYAKAAGVPVKIFWWFYWDDITCVHNYSGCSAATNTAQLKAVNTAAFPATPPP